MPTEKSCGQITTKMAVFITAGKTNLRLGWLVEFTVLQSFMS